MIEKPTVLVLGAGASQPYGFPTSSELRDEILDNLTPPIESHLSDQIKRFHIDPYLIQDFYHAILDSDLSSVDAVLEHIPELSSVGKFVIWFLLKKCERNRKLNPQENNWYRYLFDRLQDTSPEKFKQNKLSIITFNYDRSIEQYLFKTINTLFRRKLDDEKIKEMYSCIPIIHVHGKLGPIHLQEESDLKYELKQSVLDTLPLKRIQNAIDQIKIIPEEHDNSPEFDEAFDKMKNADKIFFLGFGYYKRNLERLRVEKLSTKMMWGTGYKLAKTRIIDIKRDWKIIIKSSSEKVLDFFDNRARLN